MKVKTIRGPAFAGPRGGRRRPPLHKKKAARGGIRAAGGCSVLPGSEPELSSNLQGARSGVCAKESAENTGRRGDAADAISELRIGYIADWLIEVGMVENVEGLCSDCEFSALPLRHAEILHQRKIRVEEVGPVDLITALVAERPNAGGRRDRRCEFRWCHAGGSWFEIVEDVGGATR